MPLLVRADDPVLAWRGAVSVESTPDGVVAWRIPHEDRALYHKELVVRARMAAGCRVCFMSDTRAVAGEAKTGPDTHRLDLVADGSVAGSVELAGKDGFAFEELPPASGPRPLELWLPQTGEFRLKSLRLSDGAGIAHSEDARPRWITYGSSISHCSAASSPTETWPAVVARERGLNLTCLGFGGNCHLEPMVARLIRDLPADLISMCVGINIYGGASLGPRTLRESVIGFVKIVREKHPDAPFVVMSPILSPDREEKPNAVGLTLRGVRDEVASAVEALRSRGDANAHYVSGLDVFGPDLAGLLPDGVHPDAEGYRTLGRNFSRNVAARLFVR